MAISIYICVASDKVVTLVGCFSGWTKPRCLMVAEYQDGMRGVIRTPCATLGTCSEGPFSETRARPSLPGVSAGYIIRSLGHRLGRADFRGAPLRAGPSRRGSGLTGEVVAAGGSQLCGGKEAGRGIGWEGEGQEPFVYVRKVGLEPECHTRGFGVM